MCILLALYVIMARLSSSRVKYPKREDQRRVKDSPRKERIFRRVLRVQEAGNEMSCFLRPRNFAEPDGKKFLTMRFGLDRTLELARLKDWPLALGITLSPFIGKEEKGENHVELEGRERPMEGRDASSIQTAPGEQPPDSK